MSHHQDAGQNQLKTMNKSFKLQQISNTWE